MKTVGKLFAMALSIFFLVPITALVLEMTLVGWKLILGLCPRYFDGVQNVMACRGLWWPAW